jgi:hypothetical protein
MKADQRETETSSIALRERLLGRPHPGCGDLSNAWFQSIEQSDFGRREEAPDHYLGTDSRHDVDPDRFITSSCYDPAAVVRNAEVAITGLGSQSSKEGSTRLVLEASIGDF